MLVLKHYVFQDITLELQSQSPASNEGEGIVYNFKLTGLDFFNDEFFSVQVVDGVLRQRTGSHLRSGWGELGPQQDFEVALKQLLSKLIRKKLSCLIEEVSELNDILNRIS